MAVADISVACDAATGPTYARIGAPNTETHVVVFTTPPKVSVWISTDALKLFPRQRSYAAKKSVIRKTIINVRTTVGYQGYAWGDNGVR